MIKKLILNIIVFTLIINSCVCIIYNVYNYIQSENMLNSMVSDESNSKKTHTLSINVEKDKELDDFMEERQYLGRRYILANNLVITLISYIASIFISLGIFVYDVYNNSGFYNKDKKILN